MLGVNVLEIPVEAFAFKLLSQRFAIANVAIVSKVVHDTFVKEILVLVKPHFSQSHRIPIDDGRLVGLPIVGTSLSEYVADMTARSTHQLSAAHPYLQNVNSITK